MPSHIQKEIYLHQKNRILRRIEENIYFAILNDFVGNIWIENLCMSVYKEYKGEQELNDEEIFILKDPNYVKDERRASVFKNIRKRNISFSV